MAVQAAQRAGLNASRHMQGGLQAWKSVGGSLRN
jgi:rhodanese-related sulfurtransferase